MQQSVVLRIKTLRQVGDRGGRLRVNGRESEGRAPDVELEWPVVHGGTPETHGRLQAEDQGWQTRFRDACARKVESAQPTRR